MADIPNQPIIRRIKDIMDCGREFDNAKACAQMAAGHGDCRDSFGTQFIGQLAQLRRGKITKVRGHFNRIE
jgi:hypothetical protein